MKIGGERGRVRDRDREGTELFDETGTRNRAKGRAQEFIPFKPIDIDPQEKVTLATNAREILGS